jgi:hypothetical protein
MATAFSKFPVKKTVPDGSVTNGPCLLGGVLFVATAAAAACLLQDEAGNDLINLGSGLAIGPYAFNLPKPVQIAGYKLATLTNGVAYIYLY